MARLTPARAHFIRAQAAAANAVYADAEQTSDQYMIMRAALTEDRRRLHDIQSIERKIEVKEQLLPNYQPYIDGVLHSGSGAHDDVLMTLLVWHLDTGDLDRALEIARYALQHDLRAPDGYQRTTATIIAEEVADHYLRLAAANENIDGGFARLQLTQSLTEKHDMPDQVRAKLHKAIGFAARNSNEIELALTHLRRSLELDSKAGVKTEISKLERVLENKSAD